MKLHWQINSSPTFFYKTGVYTKNRNFRLYKSSKMGKNAAFTLSDDNKFTAQAEKSMSAEESVFLASLVCNVRCVWTTLSLCKHCFLLIFLYILYCFHVISFTGQRILTWDVAEAKESRGTRAQPTSPGNKHLLSPRRGLALISTPANVFVCFSCSIEMFLCQQQTLSLAACPLLTKKWMTSY